MELLRVKAFQPFACYRKPFSYGFWDTYPLPPFSTTLGWVHWILGAKELLPMNIGVAGQINTVTYDLQTLVKFDRVRKEKSQTILNDFNKALSSSPTYVANITNVNLRIYIQMRKEYLETFKDRILRVNYPSLGRYEDLVRIDEVVFVTLEKKSIGNFDEPIPIDYAVYLKPETAFVTGNKGSNFQLPFYHQLVNEMRFFEKEKVVFTDSGHLSSGEFLLDTESDEIFKQPVIVELFGKY